jgi:threonine/homoserine/homoserine lactone efflux protein
MDLVADLLIGAGLGLSLAIPPGPMNALIASQSVRSRRLGTIVGAGAMSADAILGTLVYLLRSEIDLGPYLRWLYLVGAGVLVLFGFLVLRRASQAVPPPVRELRLYTSALAMGLSNPFQILWWLTAGLAFAFVGGIVLFVALFGAIAVWVVGFPIAIELGARDRPQVQRAISYLSGALLFVFAAYLLYLFAV